MRAYSCRVSSAFSPGASLERNGKNKIVVAQFASENNIIQFVLQMRELFFILYLLLMKWLEFFFFRKIEMLAEYH